MCRHSRKLAQHHRQHASIWYNSQDVITYTSAYLDGLTAEGDIIQCIKHFPGDGTEERDQHLVLGVNELSPERWEEVLASLSSSYKSWG